MCELMLCQKSTWRVAVYKMDKYITCRVCCAPEVCTNTFLRYTALLVTIGNRALLGEVTMWSLILNLSFFPELSHLKFQEQRCISLLFRAVGAMQSSSFSVCVFQAFF